MVATTTTSTNISKTRSSSYSKTRHPLLDLDDIAMESDMKALSLRDVYMESIKQDPSIIVQNLLNPNLRSSATAAATVKFERNASGASLEHISKDDQDCPESPNSVAVNLMTNGDNSSDNFTDMPDIRENQSQGESFKLYFKGKDGSTISPWHDIRLRDASTSCTSGERSNSNNHSNETFQMVVEVPKFSKAEMAVAVDQHLNPINQAVTTENGKLKDYTSAFYWNMGFFPQTWQGDMDANSSSSNDVTSTSVQRPLGAIEIGSKPLPLGSVAKVKIIGALGVLMRESDDAEPILDWKLICIRANDPMAERYSQNIPQAIKSGIREWFRWHKTPDGFPAAEFALEEQYVSRQSSHQMLHQAHADWKDLVGTSVSQAKTIPTVPIVDRQGLPLSD